MSSQASSLSVADLGTQALLGLRVTRRCRRRGQLPPPKLARPTGEWRVSPSLTAPLGLLAQQLPGESFRPRDS
jgi:hypothetical protein